MESLNFATRCGRLLFRAIGLVEQLGNGGRKRLEHRFLRVLRGRPLVLADDLAGARQDAGEDFRPAQIDPYGMSAVHPEPLP